MEKKIMSDNMEIFVNFLADNFALTKYIIAYTKRYNICNNPFYINVSRKARRNPKGLFKDVLGSGAIRFKKLEEKWLEYVKNTIDYVPERGDVIYCSYFDEEKCERVEWLCQFDYGTKESFTDVSGHINDKQTFVRKGNTKEVETLLGY